jgi:long-chain acyl-CoA synthetase
MAKKRTEPPPRQSLAEFFRDFERHPEDGAFAQSEGYRVARWTFRHIAETAGQFARELESRGIAPGDRVLIWGPNSAEWAAAFWGCILRGAVVVPMDWAATEDFARRVARQVEAKVVVATRERTAFDLAAGMLALEDLPKIIAHHDTGQPGMRYASPVLERASVAEIVFTSGTTAEPKGVVITHGNILANLEPIEREIQRFLPIERLVHPIRFLNLLPLSHVFGQFLGLFLPPVMAGMVLFQDSLGPADVIRTIRRERVSVLVAVPRVLESLRRKVERDLEDFGQSDWLARELHAAEGERFYRHWWRFRRIHRQFGWKFWAMICGGATLPTETEAFWDRLGFAVVQGYGLTETTSLISLNHPFQMGRGSIGKVLPGREVKLGEDGEILVRGESVAAGYWQSAHPGQSQQAEGTSWLHTGDIGEMDAEGRLYFKGRKKNVIVTPAGMNVYPEDLEAALRRQPEVRDCVVIPVARDGNADACAVLILRAPGTDGQAIVDRANSGLAEYQRIRRWYLWPEADFPRTSTGKPRTEAIAARIAQPERAAATAEGLAGLMARISGRSATELKPEARLEADLGLSSLDRVELLSAIEDRYQLSLNEAQLSGDTTVAELEGLIGTGSVRAEDPNSSTGGRKAWTASGETGATEQPARTGAPPSVQDPYPRWTQHWPATWIRAAVYTLLTWPATHLFAHPRVRGREHVPGRYRPLLIASNHVTPEDIGFIAAALPMRYRYRLAVAMGGERLRAYRNPPPSRGFFGALLDRVNYVLVVLLFNVFPLPRLSGFRQSFQYAGESVDRGYSVVVFPEGAVTQDGRLVAFRSGIGLLAANLRIPVLPVRIDGLFEMRQAHRIWARSGFVRVSIGKPLEFPPGESAEKITREIESAVAELEWRT